MCFLTNQIGNYNVCHLFVQSSRAEELNTISPLYDIHETPLHMVSKRFCSNAWKICQLLIHAGADIDPICNNETPLMAAVTQGHILSVQYLLQQKADVNYQQTTGICQLLIDNDANIELCDDDRTPLMTAVMYVRISAVKYLLERKANMNCEQNNGATMLHHAVRIGSLEMCQLLIKSNANIENIYNDKTPLMLAVLYGDIFIVKYLLENRADVHYKQITGTTCLHHAAREGFLDVCELLYTYNGNVHAMDIHGPVHEIRGNPIIEDFLERKLIEYNTMFKRACTGDYDDNDNDNDNEDDKKDDN